MGHLPSLLISGKDKRCIILPLKKNHKQQLKQNHTFELSGLLKVTPVQFLSQTIKSISMIYVCYKVAYQTFFFFHHRLSNSVLFTQDHKSRKKHIDHLVFFDFFLSWLHDYMPPTCNSTLCFFFLLKSYSQVHKTLDIRIWYTRHAYDYSGNNIKKRIYWNSRVISSSPMPEWVKRKKIRKIYLVQRET